jgi:hypothetical protein
LGALMQGGLHRAFQFSAEELTGSLSRSHKAF